MPHVAMPPIGFSGAWRDAARDLLRDGVRPGDVTWTSEGEDKDLFVTAPLAVERSDSVASPSVPKDFLPLAEAAICHSGPGRFSLSYRVLWRLQQDRALLADRADPDVAALHGMAQAVRRDNHKMHAFVRFRELGTGQTGRRQFGAWFEPQHHIVELSAPFFVRRFADMDWMIATPGLAARFVDGKLSIEECPIRPDLPEDDADDLWRTYFANIFNPARLKIKAMKSEMPVRYWKNMPEARLIPAMIAGADEAAREMQQKMPSVAHLRTERVVRRVPLAPEAIRSGDRPETIAEARAAALTCTRCDLCRYATQTVFGDGPEGAEVMFVGEQPGDEEDLAGKPFVGPAGRLLDDVLVEAGIDRRRHYITNAVKHFKFVPRGKRRLHQRPDAHEVERCKWWLDLELSLIRPKLIVAMGATAAQAITGRADGIIRRRATIENLPDGLPVFLTVHPSSILRAGNSLEQRDMRREFMKDMRALAPLLDKG
ncbi:MAG: UdgX family uracil-DNA binding protein [Rhizobium sp.]|nr:UdgX family uracil-DNA binding protein [Rhizobium sp.]